MQFGAGFKESAEKCFSKVKKEAIKVDEHDGPFRASICAEYI